MASSRLQVWSPGCCRMTVRYKAIRGEDAALRERIKAIAHERRRFGYRRLHVLLRREGYVINHKRLFSSNLPLRCSVLVCWRLAAWATIFSLLSWLILHSWVMSYVLVTQQCCCRPGANSYRKRWLKCLIFRLIRRRYERAVTYLFFSDRSRDQPYPAPSHPVSFYSLQHRHNARIRYNVHGSSGDAERV